MPHEELTYYMTAGYIQGYKCQKSGVEINHCLYKHIEKNYKYYKAFHTDACKYKVFEEKRTP